MPDSLQTTAYLIFAYVFAPDPAAYYGPLFVKGHLTLTTDLFSNVCHVDTIVVWDWTIALPRESFREWRGSLSPDAHTQRLPSTSYWVIAVVPYLLWAFCTNHTIEECEKIYRIPVALAMWNQVTSEVILFVRTYAFFKRNNYILTLLVVALAGVVAYQLYVDTTSLPTRDGAMPSNVQASFGASVRLPLAPRMCCSLSKCCSAIAFTMLALYY
ncbi:hypothetical protein BC835DRAFT_1310783 [Cytidiella melzeri]|nr:hypothetical protein BC835DRAFT_1310783 [Cytidiella melzeri]